MKTILITLMILIMSCSSPSQEKDKSPVVLNPIEDINIEEGQETWSGDLTDVFNDSDNENTEMILTVLSNTNPSLLSAAISTTTMTISYNLTITGSSTITVQAESNGKFVTDDFLVTVTANGASVSLTAGASALSSKNWASAKSEFQAAITHGDARYKEEAYMGLGFSEMKLYDPASAYSSLSSGLNLSSSEYNSDFNMILTLLEYSHKQNYSAAVTKALALLSSNSFSFHFDSSINEKDIRITLAMSYYNLNDYTNALAQAKILDSSIELVEADDDFERKLATELNRLSGEYHSKM